MTKTHFEAIARILSADLAVSTTDAERNKVRGIALSMSDYFLSINPRFSRETFLTACGL